MMKLSRLMYEGSNPENYDVDRCARQLIARVLECGEQEDWYEILQYYGKERIAKEVIGMRWMEPLSRAFLCVLLEIPEDSFRSYHFQLEHPEIYFWLGPPEPTVNDRSNIDRWPDYHPITKAFDRIASPSYPW